MTDQEQVVADAAPETATVEPQSADTAAPADAENPETPATSDQPGDAPAADEPKKDGGVQKRINELTQEKYREKLRADGLQRELDAVRNPKPVTEHGAEPKIEDFDKVQDFLESHKKWAKEEGRREALKEAEAGEATRTVQSQAKAVHARETKAAEKYPDYWDATNPVAEVVMSNPTLKQYMIESDLSAEVGYHLAKNPETLEKLLGMTPTGILRELINLEAKVTAPPPPKAPTKAPNPVPPVGGREATKRGLADLSTEEYIARRNKQELAARATG